MNHQMKKAPALSAAARQMGLTLIELTIVLLILIGLSGLLLPFVQGFIDKTHDSANADSLKEVSKQVEEYNTLYSGLPEKMDSLIVGQDETVATVPTVPFPLYTGTGKDELYQGMMNTGLYSVTALTTPMITQFNNAGLSQVSTFKKDAGPGGHTLRVTDGVPALLALASADPSATSSFSGNDLGVLVALDETKMAGNLGAVCSVQAGAAAATAAEANECLAELFNKPVGDIDSANMTYFVLGIGNDASLVGRTMSEAPIHFAKVGGMNAANKYNRILAAFEVKTADMKGHMAAKFMGTLMPMMKIEGLAQAQGAYYKGDGV